MIKSILPLMTNDEILYLVNFITINTVMLEIGGGNSTIFLSKIVRKLTTIEHNLEWSKIIKDKLKNIDTNWELHVIEPNFKQSHVFQPAQKGQFDNYVKFISKLPDNEFDVILIDGRDRVRCSIECIPKLKKDGILLIHDFWNRKRYHTLLEENKLELIDRTNPKTNTLAAFKKI